MAKTAQEIFGGKTQEVLEEKADKLEGVSAIFCFEISGEGGGTWTLDLKNKPFSVVEGEGGAKADCTIKVAHEDFQKLLENFAIAMQLFTTGKLKVDNPMAAMKLQKVLPLLA